MRRGVEKREGLFIYKVIDKTVWFWFSVLFCLLLMCLLLFV